MKKVIILLLISVLLSCSNVTEKSAEMTEQKLIYKSWVLSRCLSHTFENKEQKQDALNTASAYLEQSNIAVEQFLNAEPLIQKFLGRTYEGSIKGTFNTQKCIDLFNSAELDTLYREMQK